MPTRATGDAEAAGRRGSIKVLLVDDQREVRRGLRMRLELEPDIEVVGEAEDGRVFALAAALGPDVVLMDVAMGDLDGIEAAGVLAARGTAVVMLTIHDDAGTRQRAAAAGSAGFVGKHRPEGELIAAIRHAARPAGTR